VAASIWFVSPAWRRYEVTRMVLAQRRHCMNVLERRGFETGSVIVADDDNLDIAREYGMDTVEHANIPLGRKTNAGLRYAGEQGADWIVYVGSDDWVHPDLFGAIPAEPQTRRTPEIITGRRIAIVDLITGRLTTFHAPGRYGVIPWIVPRAALEGCGFAPITNSVRRGLDGSFVRGLAVRPEWRFEDPHPYCRVDFKTPMNLTSYETLRRALGHQAEEDAWEALGRYYPAELVELARKTQVEVA